MPEYSQSPLVKKLAIKPKTRLATINAPSAYRDWLGELPPETTCSETLDGTFDWIHVFATKQQELYDQLPSLKEKLAPDGILWVSFPRDKQKTDMSRNSVLPAAMQPFGFTPVANAVINDDWTGYRLKHLPS
jgi:hypothetical protein